MMQISDLGRALVSPKPAHRSASREDLPARQKVAILSTWHPEPVDNGRKQRTRFIIASLASRYDVVLVSLLPQEEVGAPLALVPGVCHQVVLPLPVFKPGRVGSLLRAASPYPRSISATWSESTAHSIADTMRELEVRLVIGTDLRTLRYLTALEGRIQVILDEPDVSPFVISDGRGSLRARARARKFNRLLESSTQRLSTSIVASEHEAGAYRALSGGGHTTIVENAVSEIPDTRWTPNVSNTLLYTGSARYGPNAEAMEYFARQILPAIPDVTLTITGDLPGDIPDALRHPRVNLTGRLDSLTDSFLQARLFIAPILSGTGTRVKLLEALAYGMPVVSTTKGAEGLPVEHGKHLLLADEPDDFIEAVLKLLHDPLLSYRLGTAGRQLVADRFTWESQGRILRELVGSVLAREG